MARHDNLCERDVRHKASRIAWGIVQPMLHDFFEESTPTKPEDALSKIIAGEIENMIVDEFQKFQNMG